MGQESKIESYFEKQWQAIGGEVRKVKWIGRRNAPDRFAAVVGWSGFIEFKAPGKKLRVGQAREVASLRAQGVNVEVFDSFEKVNTFISKIKRRIARLALK
jgi:hypothetical protein